METYAPIPKRPLATLAEKEREIKERVAEKEREGVTPQGATPISTKYHTLLTPEPASMRERENVPVLVRGGSAVPQLGVIKSSEEVQVIEGKVRAGAAKDASERAPASQHDPKYIRALVERWGAQHKDLPAPEEEVVLRQRSELPPVEEMLQSEEGRRKLSEMIQEINRVKERSAADAERVRNEDLQDEYVRRQENLKKPIIEMEAESASPEAKKSFWERTKQGWEGFTEALDRAGAKMCRATEERATALLGPRAVEWIKGRPEWYLNLPPKTKIMISVGLMGVSFGLGAYVGATGAAAAVAGTGRLLGILGSLKLSNDLIGKRFEGKTNRYIANMLGAAVMGSLVYEAGHLAEGLLRDSGATEWAGKHLSSFVGGGVVAEVANGSGGVPDLGKSVGGVPVATIEPVVPPAPPSSAATLAASEFAHDEAAKHIAENNAVLERVQNASRVLGEETLRNEVAMEPAVGVDAEHVAQGGAHVEAAGQVAVSADATVAPTPASAPAVAPQAPLAPAAPSLMEQVHTVTNNDTMYSVLKKIPEIEALGTLTDGGVARQTNAIENMLAAMKAHPEQYIAHHGTGAINLDHLRTGDTVNMQAIYDKILLNPDVQMRDHLTILEHAKSGLSPDAIKNIESYHASAPNETPTGGGSGQEVSTGNTNKPPFDITGTVERPPVSVSPLMAQAHIDPSIAQSAFGNVSQHIVEGNEASASDVSWSNLRGLVGELVHKSLGNDFATNLTNEQRMVLGSELRDKILGAKNTFWGGWQYGTGAAGKQTVEQILQDTQAWLTKVRALGVKI